MFLLYAQSANSSRWGPRYWYVLIQYPDSSCQILLFKLKNKKKSTWLFHFYPKYTKYIWKISNFHKEIVVSTVSKKKSSSFNWHLYTVMHPTGTVPLYSLKQSGPHEIMWNYRQHFLKTWLQLKKKKIHYWSNVTKELNFKRLKVCLVTVMCILYLNHLKSIKW